MSASTTSVSFGHKTFLLQPAHQDDWRAHFSSIFFYSPWCQIQTGEQKIILLKSLQMGERNWQDCVTWSHTSTNISVPSKNPLLALPYWQVDHLAYRDHPHHPARSQFHSGRKPRISALPQDNSEESSRYLKQDSTLYLSQKFGISD